MNLRQTEIDLDVHKTIENARVAFGESDNDVLRRLLGIAKPWKPETALPTGKAWSSKGVSLPSGTRLRMEYNGVEHLAEIRDGKWIANGCSFAGPSPAAAEVASTKAGKKTSLNGWIYWYAQRPGETSWAYLADLRNK